MNPATIVVSVLAGIASALLVFSSAGTGMAFAPLLFAGSLPIYIATLGWGTSAGILSSTVAIFGTSFVVSGQGAIILGVLFTIPAAIAAHQANLAQIAEDGEGVSEWYPIDRLFMNLCILVAIGILVTGYMAGYSEERLRPLLMEFVNEIFQANAAPLSEADAAAFANQLFTILPFVFSGMWLVTHVLNFYIGASITRASGKLPRPRDDIAATLSLPRYSLIALPVSLVLMLISPPPLQHVFAVAAGVLFMAFALVGLAHFHLKLRGSPAAFFILGLIYASIIFIQIPLAFFAVSGVFLVSTGRRQPTLPGPPMKS